MSSSSDNFDVLICQRFNSWSEVINKARHLKHFERRKLIKKYKRSLKRKHKAIELNKGVSNEIKNTQSVLTNSSDQCRDNILLKPFICSTFINQTISKSIKNIPSSPSLDTISSHVSDNCIHANLNLVEQKNKQSLISNVRKGTTEELSFLSQPNNELKDKYLDEYDDNSQCNFFALVGACTSTNCQKHHKEVVKSCVILISSMYTFVDLGVSSAEQKGNAGLSSSKNISAERQKVPDDFTEFLEDVCQELKKFGLIKNLIVCCNKSPHLKGNVYVEYETCLNSQKAYENLQGRFYDGKMLNCTYVNINDWNEVLCKKHYKGGNCKRDYICNYLHIFSYCTNNCFDFYDKSSGKEFVKLVKNKKHSKKLKKTKKSKKDKLSKKNKKKKSKKYKKYKSSPYRQIE